MFNIASKTNLQPQNPNFSPQEDKIPDIQVQLAPPVLLFTQGTYWPIKSKTNSLLYGHMQVLLLKSCQIIGLIGGWVKNLYSAYVPLQMYAACLLSLKVSF